MSPSRTRLHLLVFAFGKERFHNAVEIEIFGSFIDTNLAPPKNFSGANDVIFVDHVLLAGIVFHVLPRVCPHWFACLFYMLTNTTLHRLGFVNSYILIAFVDLFLSGQ